MAPPLTRSTLGTLLSLPYRVPVSTREERAIAELKRRLSRRSRRLAIGCGLLIVGIAIGVIGLNSLFWTATDGSMRCAVQACEPDPATVPWWLIEMLMGLVPFGLGLAIVLANTVDTFSALPRSARFP
ncbi:MAG TPA: hypothetical protein VEO20_00290 [Thermoplasmata archaeon]|nr:hypothetical protein [Thermoplasmata archaeon]